MQQTPSTAPELAPLLIIITPSGLATGTGPTVPQVGSSWVRLVPVPPDRH
jgi:hypothetical protein